MRGILIGFVLLLVLLLPSVNAQEGIVSYWSFDNSSNPGKDDVGGNDGTVYGATWVSNGIKGGALIFDGEDDYIDLGDVDMLEVSEGSGAVWFKTSASGGTSYIYNDAAWGYYLRMNSTGGVEAGFSGSWGINRVYSDTNLNDGEWHHAVWTYDHTVTQTANLYIDGELHDTNTTIGYIGTNSVPFTIGRYGAGGFFNGTIDEVRIYNRTLSAEEILEHYSEGIGYYSAADLNNDGIVDIFDMGIVAIHFGQTPPHPNWNETVDVVENDEIDIFDVVFVASRFSRPDTTPPEVTSFDVNPKNTTDSITATWTVTDNKALKQTELWRTNDDNGQPYEGNWSLVPGKTQSISGAEASGSFTDTPPDGTWWYRLHVIDNANNTGYAQPINVTKSAPPPCTGECMMNPCDLYDNCTTASGTCPLGYCCSGACTPLSGNVYAASGSRDDIQAAIDSASDGDTVIIPAGTFDFGDGQVEIDNKLIHVRGAGIDQTTIEKTGPTGEDTENMFAVFMREKTGGPVFSDMKLIDTNGPYSEYDVDNATVGLGLHYGCYDFRVYNMEFEGFGYAGIFLKEYGGPTPGIQWKQRGVIYNCRFIDCYMPGLGYGIQVLGADDRTWNEGTGLGTAYAVFVEDCYFEGQRHHIASGRGSRYVFRYNSCKKNKGSHGIDAHGWYYGSETTRGSLNYEIYENIIEDPIFVAYDDFGMGLRGGSGVVYNNTIKDMSVGIRLSVNGCQGKEPPCEYPVQDQINNLYIWGNSYIGCDKDIWMAEDIEPLVQENRDYFLYERPGYTPYTYPHPLRE